ncbi:MAG: pyruvate ferredoxin oxidoreductase [Candidatus Falkowbacteria bacterium]|nr:pyruvate ferredoxin oxidoreductase [Candidatus Falkowbacteria bacterium]
MQKQKKQFLEGSRAIAMVIANIQPQVVSAYPITPQTHIVEDLANLHASGKASFEYVRAESEFSAASIVMGASATGARTYSATSGQGLLLMNEVVYCISGLRLPVVMTDANRAVSAPINIWNDHSDTMTVRDAGWLQFFAENHQEAVDQHILAYKIAEKYRLPAMVNVDGFILTHLFEPVIIPEPTLIKKFLPARPIRIGEALDPKHPSSLGEFYGPEFYFEAREKLHENLLASAKDINTEYKNFQKIFAREKSNALIDNGFLEYCGPKKPKTIIIAMGSVIGTIKETLKDKKYQNVGVLKIKCFRPFPHQEIATILKDVKQVAILEKASGNGTFSPLYLEISSGIRDKKIIINNFVAGLGGRDISRNLIKKMLRLISAKNIKPVFLGK